LSLKALRRGTRVELLRDPEVEQLDALAVRRDPEIRRLDVAMYDPSRVCPRKGFSRGIQEPDGLEQRERWSAATRPGLQPLVEISSIEPVQDDVRDKRAIGRGDLPHGKNLDDVLRAELVQLEE